MSVADSNPQDAAISLESATNWARSNREWEKVYRYIFLHPKDFFVIIQDRRWPIAHQVVYHGDIDLLKRMLAVFSDDQIDIRTKSKDGKTLLDVATERHSSHPAMHTYVELLFSQDELIGEAKQANWRAVQDLLDKNKDLANQKPPYSPYFLLHYVVENGDAQILDDLLGQFQFLTNVLNNKNETPLAMAVRLQKYDMCRILQPKTIARPSYVRNESQTTPTEPSYRSQERSTTHSTVKSLDEPSTYQAPTSMPNPTTKPISTKSKLPPIGFGGIVVDISESGDFTVESSALINSVRNPPIPPRPTPPSKQQPQASTLPPKLQPQPSTGFPHVHRTKTIITECPLTNLDPTPPSPRAPPPKPLSAMSAQLKKNLTCTLTQEIFVDPVIATDGQTYERAAILDWVNVYHCSPTTGAQMDATFRDNTEIKNIIQSIRGKK